MTFSNIPDELTYEIQDTLIKFTIANVSTYWMGESDSFFKRIDINNLNKELLTQHLIKEIEIKNILDDGLNYLKKKKYPKAIECFDKVLYYDSEYGEALLNKSYALYGEKHFVKSLRYYKKAIKTDSNLKDSNYYKLLLQESNNERGNFPKIKQDIYLGDEYFTRGEFEKALDLYNRALANPSKFREKILPKLINKKARTLIRLGEYGEAYSCFKKSIGDCAIFGRGYCEFKLGFDINDEFKTILDVGKKQQLKQAVILNQLGYWKDSLKICDYLANNHFRCDDFYFKLKELITLNVSLANL